MNTPKDYPVDWPRCPVCDDFALDGHITCGRAECDEGGARRRRRGDPNYDTLEEKRMDLPPKSYCDSVTVVAAVLALALATTLTSIAIRLASTAAL